eukprot:TRINITY_DN59617_c0_g1_i1.p1 TRINITY_DN59617_c0_g1~~TRINITY_DN59617_c0_g1_i1.p1  ORF type:complete len:694 (-),score=73.16 TRINITY_DN59617_c0_g1_i1:88-2169(-)
MAIHIFHVLSAAVLFIVSDVAVTLNDFPQDFGDAFVQMKATYMTSSESSEGAEWVFALYEKEGSGEDEVLVRELCAETGRQVQTYDFHQERKPCSGCCHILFRPYPESIRPWLDHVHTSSSHRFVQFARDPAQLVVASYERIGSSSEDAWVNSATCTRELCVLSEKRSQGKSEEEANNELRDDDMGRHLRAVGCSVDDKSYGECWKKATAQERLNIEADRLYPLVSSMVGISERISKDDKAMSVCYDEAGVADTNALFSWLGLTPDALLDSSKAKHSRVSSESSSIDAWTEIERNLKIRELRARSACSNISTPRLFRDKALFKKASKNSRGIVMCSAPPMLQDTLQALKRIRLAGCDLPVEVWHVGELDDAGIKKIESEIEGSSVRDLTPKLSHELPSDEVQALRSFMCKPLAVLASSFEQVMMVDNDDWVFMNITELFESSTYTTFGMLIFRDRLKMTTLSHQKEAGRYIRELVRRREDYDAFFASPHLDSKRWSPSMSLTSAPIVHSDSNHHADSSLLMLDKSRNLDMAESLLTLHDRYRHELYANVHGDKEVFWLACELIGTCGVSHVGHGVLGHLNSEGCIVGNLLQFHPDDSSKIVHCNCKPDARWYTHFSSPVADRSKYQSLMTIRDSGEENECHKPALSETFPRLLSRQRQIETFDDGFCKSEGRLCDARGDCKASSLCTERPWRW